MSNSDDALAGELWSLIGRVLTQGHAQQEDWRAGKFKHGYEEFMARVDEAARERVPQFLALLKSRQQQESAEPVCWRPESIADVSLGEAVVSTDWKPGLPEQNDKEYFCEANGWRIAYGYASPTASRQQTENDK